MMTHTLLRFNTSSSRLAFALILILSSFNIQAQKLSRCAAHPEPIVIAQPDGSRLTIIGKGNTLISYTETSDGYTIALNADGFYEYATQGKNGLVAPTGVRASDPANRGTSELSYLHYLPKHIQHTKAASNEIIQKHSLMDRSSTGPRSTKSFPTKGERKALMLLIEYPDLPHTNELVELKDQMNAVNNGGTGSFRDYFLETSFGQLDVKTDVLGWYTALHETEYYGKQNGYERAQDLIAEAVDSAEAAGVDFSQYDNDGDGVVDGIIVVHSGLGAEQGNQLKYIWSHRWSLGGKSRNYDGVVIDDYMMNPERRTWGMTGIGVFCHEFGHGLGLPDLYDTDSGNGNSEGVGEWSVMGGGGWLDSEKTPCHFDSWCKTSLGWQQPKIIDLAGAYAMKSAVDTNLSYQIETQYASEYFYLENRQKKGFDKALKGHGLAIWKINDAVTGLGYGVNADEENQGVELKEADGLNDLDNDVNRGDNGDLFPGSTLNIAFSDTSNPSSILSTGENSGTLIDKIEERDDIIYFNWKLGSTSCTSAPNQPEYVDGETSFCVNGYQTYTTGKVNGASSYNWSVPAGAVIVSGQGTREISVDFGASQSQGAVCVYATNNCGSSVSQCHAVNPQTKPTYDGKMNGPDSISVCQSNIQYSIEPTSGVRYFWRVPATATLISGQYTPSISVSFGPGNSGDAVSVELRYSNTCHDTLMRIIPLTYRSLEPATITGDKNICQNYTGKIYKASSTGSTSFSWSISGTGATIASGNGTNKVTIDGTMQTGTSQLCVVPEKQSCKGLKSCYQIRANACTGVEEFEESNFFTVFPNPGNGIYQLQFNENASQTTLNVYNALGQIVLSKTKLDISKDKPLEIDLTSFSKGVYLLEINSGEEQHKSRLVFQ